VAPPKGFLDQVRVVEVPVVFFVEQSLYNRAGGPNRPGGQSGVVSFRWKRRSASPSSWPIRIVCPRSTVPRLRKRRILERLSGKAEEAEAPQAMLGKVAVVRFSQTWSDAAALDAKLRQTIPGAVAYA